MRIGVLTGGGDCPGLNAVIRAVVRKGEGVFGHNLIGFRYGWRGVIECQTVDLTVGTTPGHPPPGRHDPRHVPHEPLQVGGRRRPGPRHPERERVDALVAIGGEDTLGVASRLTDDGVRIVGVPKTIDNDLSATDFTFGFDTAVQIATDAIDRLHTTAESHDRVMVVRGHGPPRRLDRHLRRHGRRRRRDPHPRGAVRHRRRVRPHPPPPPPGRRFSIVVVAEGALPKEGTMVTLEAEVDQFGHARLGGIGTLLQTEIEGRTGFETRVTILGHIQRGGTPTAYDRVLATRFGVEAIDAVHQGDFGTMVALRGADIVRVPLADAVRELKTVDPRIYDVASVFFG